MATADVLTVNVAEVAAPGTLTDPGIDALALFDESVTEIPPEGAGPFNVTVAVEELLPSTVVGERPMLTIEGGLIVSGAEALIPFSVPPIVATVLLPTGLVLTVNVVELDPAGTVTEAPTVALELVDERLMTEPPGPASPLRVTVPVAGFPPKTDVGLSVRLVRVAGVTVKTAV